MKPLSLSSKTSPTYILTDFYTVWLLPGTRAWAPAAPPPFTGLRRTDTHHPPPPRVPASAKRSDLGCSLPGLARFARRVPACAPTSAGGAAAGPAGQDIDRGP